MTKEEILQRLEDKRDEWHGRYIWPRTIIYEAMELYAQQQTEELRKEVESLRNEKNNELARLTAPDGAITKRVLIEDNHRLTSENEQLRKEIKEWKNRQEILEDNIDGLMDQLEELRKENEELKRDDSLPLENALKESQETKIITHVTYI